MTYKIIDTREKRTMTKSQETAVIREFERFQPEGSTHIKLPQKEHLDRSFKESVCCSHIWQLITVDEAAKKFLQATFEETDLGDHQKICATCGALSLWESGELFAYDAIANAEKAEEKQDNSKRRGRK